MLIETIIAVVIILIIIVVKVLTKPLPEWHGLTGEEYLKWKRGEKGKSDMSD
jgi:hypothetical protein